MRWVFILLLLFQGAHAIKPIQSVRVADETYTLTRPLQNQYIYIGDLATILSGSLDYNRKYRYYQIQSDAYALTLTPYSKAVSVNNAVNYLAKPPVRINRMAYVPVDILSMLGYTISRTPDIIELTPPEIQPVRTEKPKIPLDSTQIKTPITQLTIAGKTYSVPEQIFTGDSQLIDCHDSLLAAGYRFSETDEALIYAYADRQIQIQKKTPVISVNKKKYTADTAPLYYHNRWLLPVSVLQTGFHYTLSLDASRLILSAPVDITGQGTRFVVKTQHPMAPVIVPERPVSLAQVIIPNAYNQATREPAVILMQFQDPHRLLLTQTDTALVLTAEPVVHVIRQRILYNNGAEIHVIGSGPITYTTQIVSNELQVRVDAMTVSDALIPAQSQHYSDLIVDKTEAAFTLTLTLNEKQPVIIREDTRVIIRFEPESKSDNTPVYSKTTPLWGKLIAIDAGHGGNDPGAIGLYGIHEKRYTRDIADKLIRRLENAGARVLNVRVSDENPSLASRVKQANDGQASILLSIHVNSFFQPEANGTETYYSKWKDRKLAVALQQAMAKTLNLRDIGVKRGNLYVLNHSTMPAALVEPAFMTNRKEANKLKDPDFRDAIAQALYDGIMRYYAIK